MVILCCSGQWHSDTQGVLCLRCREVVSHSEAFVQSRGDAVKPCLCDEPSDLLEPLTIDGNISPLCTRACAGDPDQKETRMHLRVPRHRAVVGSDRFVGCAPRLM
eukprot:m.96649 g.96649  ORF g.96649 m.96649 type:complete len:105 (+) comp16666_c0_seq10:1035-1349(+)